MEYKIVHVPSMLGAKMPDELVSKVNAEIVNGWKPQGGVCCNLVNSTMHGELFAFCQAMIKD